MKRMQDSSNSSKTKLSAHDVITLMGGTDPKLSAKLKSAIDKELTKAEYGNLPAEKAWILACRYLVRNEPEAFDSANHDDVVMQRLFPHMFTDTGERVPPKEFFSKLQFCDIAITHE